MKKTPILVICTLLLTLFPLNMHSAAQETQLFYLPIVIAPSQLSQMELAFVSNLDGDQAIFVMKGDGSGRKRVSKKYLFGPGHQFLADDDHPDWSPDGKKIAFHSWRDQASSIYVMDTEGSNETGENETRLSDGFHPKWSPDGKYIAFVSYRGGEPQIYLMNPDGSNQTRLTDGANTERGLAWSPDGQWLAVSQEGKYPQWSLSKIKADGSETHTLWTVDSTSLGISNLDWSADGEKIYFNYSYQEGGLGPRPMVWGIYSIRADGSQSQPVFLSYGVYPAESPDGQMFAFMHNARIGLMNLDGSFYKYITGPDDLSYHPDDLNYQPDWSPVIGAP